MNSTRRLTHLSLLVSIGLALSVIESTLPPLFPIPGAKLGLANIATVIALYLYGPAMALEVTLYRSILGGVLRGSLVGLFLSFSGGLLSTILMILLFTLFSRYLSQVGISVAGAVTHNATQLACAYLLVRHTALFLYLPYMILIAIPTGLVVGFSARRVSNSLEALAYNGGLGR